MGYSWLFGSLPFLDKWPCISHIELHAAKNDAFDHFRKQGELIVTSSTCGHLDMTLNWIEQIRSIGLSNFLVIAEDLPTYEYIMSSAPRNTMPSYSFGRPFSRGARQAASLDSPDFKMCHRPHYLIELIRRNVSALWIDSDAALLRNPSELLLHESDKIVLVDDQPYLKTTTRHYICSCFVSVRPSSAAEALLSTWAHVCGNKTKNQAPLNYALDFLGATVPWKLMPKKLYPCGYDAERLALTKIPGWQSPAWVHANWRVRKSAKVQFSSKFGVWHNISAPLQCGVA